MRLLLAFFFQTFHLKLQSILFFLKKLIQNLFKSKWKVNWWEGACFCFCFCYLIYILSVLYYLSVFPTNTNHDNYTKNWFDKFHCFKAVV